MSELQFAKQYLTTLDNKPTKFQPDHVFDSKTFATRVPYTLPKLSHPPHPLPPSANTTTPAHHPGAAAGPEPTQLINLTLTSARNPAFTLTLPCLPPTTALATIKQRIQTHLGGPNTVPDISKIKILHNKKPIPSSKPTLADAFADTETAGQEDVKLNVMVMGGAPDPPAQQQRQSHENEARKDVGPESEKAGVEAMEGVTTGISTSETRKEEKTDEKDELASPKFWEDLQAFLTQRLGSTEKAEAARGLFERAWRSGNARP